MSKGMSRTITLQGFTLSGITDAEKTKLRHKNEQSQWTVKYRSRAPGQGACLKGMSRTITLQGFTFLALTNGQTNGRMDGQTDGNLDSYIAPCYKQVL